MRTRTSGGVGGAGVSPAPTQLCAWINRLGEGDESCSTSKDLASHGGPESCVRVREDVGEALTGVRAGLAIEPRNQRVRGADVVPCGGRQHRWSRWMIASGRRAA